MTAQSARADLLDTFAKWDFTTRRGSREVADRILAKHRAEVLREAAEFVGNDESCGCGGCDSCVPNAFAADLDRMADEAAGSTS